jgi:hypothetical protein
MLIRFLVPRKKIFIPWRFSFKEVIQIEFIPTTQFFFPAAKYPYSTRLSEQSLKFLN